MGSGSWSVGTYASNTGANLKSGSTFGYTRDIYTQDRRTWKSHADLDPKKVAGPGSPFAGQRIRESRDSAEHPNSTPIAVFFDQTGSMGNVPRVVQQKLAGLFSLLIDKKYCDDPQVLIGAYGDAYTDQVPLQVSQFESDNRIDDNLDKIFLEGNGGGNGGETMSLAWYFLAHHTATDSWEKRQQKGYAFFIADEVALPITSSIVKSNVGDDLRDSSIDISNKGLVKEMKKTWEPFILVIKNASSRIQGSYKFYCDLFGEENVLLVENEASIAETIALAVGAMEGSINIDEAADDLKSTGSNEVAIRSAVNAVEKLGKRSAGKVVRGVPDLGLDDDSSTARL